MSKRSFSLLLVLVMAVFAAVSVAARGDVPATATGYFYVMHADGVASDVAAAVEAAGGRINNRYDRIDTLAVALPMVAADTIAAVDGVTLIEPIPVRYLNAETVPYNVDQVHAREIWDANMDGIADPGAPTGSSVTVCIMDTGFLASHEDFQGINVTGWSQISGEDWFEDGDGHGTHVAGTVNAVNNTVGVVGMAPGGVSLHIIKVFNNNGVWVPGQSDLISAAYDCAANGADIISMSLGSSGASAAEEAAFDDMYNNYNILNVAAAGNGGGPTNHYPSSYESVVSVGAIDEASVIADFSEHPPTQYDPLNPPPLGLWDSVEVVAGGVQVLSTSNVVHDHRVNIGPYEILGNDMEVAADGSATGRLFDGGLCLDGSGTPEWQDKVVICERGDVTFNEKITEVWESGGRAAIIYNNAIGNFNGTCQTSCGDIPAISVSQEEGQALVMYGLGYPTTVTSNIYPGNNGYVRLNGTSMATPGIAGVAAMFWDTCGGPDGVIKNHHVRRAIRLSAADLGDAGWDQFYGWGVAQLDDAVYLADSFPITNCYIPPAAPDAPALSGIDIGLGD